MKRIFLALLVMSSVSAFASEVVESSKTSKGVKASISYNRACSYVGPFCVSYPHKWEKTVDCHLENGVLTAEVSYVYNLTYCKQVKGCPIEASEPSVKKLNLKVEDLCEGASPDVVILNHTRVL